MPAKGNPVVTVSTDAPADTGSATEGQAPADTSSTDPAGPGELDTGSEGGDGPRGRRAGTEKVRSASRDDDEPQDDADGKPGKGADDAGKAKGDWKVEDLPAGAQKLIADLRKENSTRRTEASDSRKAREAAEKKAAAGDERFANATEAFMKALGLTPEPDEPERSPEELLGEVTQKYQHTRVELAVYRASAEHDADPDALLDSRSFLTKALALDPGGDEFDQAIAAAIGDAVEGNPKLRAREPARPAFLAPSGGDFGGGPAEPLGPDEWSVDDFRRNRKEKGRGTY